MICLYSFLSYFWDMILDSPLPLIFKGPQTKIGLRDFPAVSQPSWLENEKEQNDHSEGERGQPGCGIESQLGRQEPGQPGPDQGNGDIEDLDEQHAENHTNHAPHASYNDHT